MGIQFERYWSKMSVTVSAMNDWVAVSIADTISFRNSGQPPNRSGVAVNNDNNVITRRFRRRIFNLTNRVNRQH